MSDRFARLIAGPGGNRLRDASYLSLPHKYLYVDTPKAACTTLKQLVARVEDLAEDDFRASLAVDSKIEMLIHDHSVFDVPSLVDVAPATADEALNSPEFFRFCFVRNPYSRMFSAWQSKILLREPYFLVSAEPGWLDAFSEASSWEDIRHSFARFIRHIFETEYPNFSNPHWLPQSGLILHGKIDYTLIGRVKSFTRDIEPFFTHLRGQGVAPPQLSNSNPGLLRDWRWFYNDDTSTLMHAMYRDDFENFGYAPSFEGHGDAGRSLPADAGSIRPRGWIEEITARNEMIVFFRARLLDAMAREAVLRQELETLRHERAAPPPPTSDQLAPIEPPGPSSQPRSLWSTMAQRLIGRSLW